MTHENFITHVKQRKYIYIKGLCNLGLGKLDMNTKRFKRFLPTDDDCPDKENLESKWKRLDISLY